MFVADCPDLPEYHNTVMLCDCEAANRIRRDRIARLREQSDLPPRLLAYSFDTYRHLDLSDKQHGAAQICEAYVQSGHLTLPDGRRYGLFLHGNVGTGKSGLAAAICNAAMNSGNGVLYRPVPDLFDDLRNTFKPSSEASFDNVLDGIKNVDLLVLDDLGTESPTAWVTEKLFQIIDHRYRRNMRCVVTSNFSPYDLMARFEQKDDVTGRRIVDRLMEMCAVIEVNGRNLRV